MASNLRLAARAHRQLVRIVLAGLLVAVIGAATSAAVAAASRSIKDQAHLGEVGSEENTIRESGKASGSLPGTVRVSLTIEGKEASASFTIDAVGGSISGTGSGKLKAGKDGYDSFGGLLRVTKGSGRYAGATGSGEIYGSIDRLNEHLSVQVDGTLHY